MRLPPLIQRITGGENDSECENYEGNEASLENEIENDGGNEASVGNEGDPCGGVPISNVDSGSACGWEIPESRPLDCWVNPVPPGYPVPMRFVPMCIPHPSPAYTTTVNK